MLKIRTFMAACMVCMLFSVPALAQVESTFDFSGNINELEDVDFESAVGGDGDDQIEVGEFLLAVLEVDKLNSIAGADVDPVGNSSTSSSLFADYTEATATLTAISLIKVSSVTVLGGGLAANFVFSGASAAEWFTHTGLTGISDGTAAIAFDDPPTGTHLEEDTASLAASIATAVNGTRLWEFGIPLGGFWSANTTDLTGPTFDATDITQIDSLNFLASLNVIDGNGAVELGFHRALADRDLSGPAHAAFAVPTQLQLQGNLETGNSGIWTIRTDTNLYLRPVPEPTSILAWAGIAAVFGGCRRRGRRQQA